VNLPLLFKKISSNTLPEACNENQIHKQVWRMAS